MATSPYFTRPLDMYGNPLARGFGLGRGAPNITPAPVAPVTAVAPMEQDPSFLDRMGDSLTSFRDAFADGSQFVSDKAGMLNDQMERYGTAVAGDPNFSRALSNFGTAIGGYQATSNPFTGTNAMANAIGSFRETFDPMSAENLARQKQLAEIGKLQKYGTAKSTDMSRDVQDTFNKLRQDQANGAPDLQGMNDVDLLSMARDKIANRPFRLKAGQEQKTAMNENARTANNSLNNAEQALQLAKQIKEGSFGTFSNVMQHARKLGSAFKISVDNREVENVELFNQKTKNLVLDQMDKIKGVLSDSDMALVVNSVANSTNTKGSVLKSLELLKVVSQRAKEYSNAVADAVEKNQGAEVSGSKLEAIYQSVHKKYNSRINEILTKTYSSESKGSTSPSIDATRSNQNDTTGVISKENWNKLTPEQQNEVIRRGYRVGE